MVPRGNIMDDEKAKIQIEEGENPYDYVDLTGTWLVSFGYGLYIEGSKIFTLGGLFKKETLIDYLVKLITEELPQEAKDVLRENDARIMIRGMDRLS